jgi:hypothetical protein
MSVTLDKGLELGEISGFRSLYPVRFNGDLIAFLGYPVGWGKAWTLHKLQLVSDARTPASIPQVDGCLPVVRSEGTRRIGQKDGRAAALHFLSQSENREGWPTRAQLIEKQAKVVATLIESTSDLLAGAIMREAEKIRQIAVIRELMAESELIIGQQRIDMLTLLSEMAGHGIQLAKTVARYRDELENYYKAAASTTDAAPGLTLGQLSRGPEGV